MAKKSIDSEALKKNQFWIGLGAFVLLWLVALVVVLFSGNDEAKKKWTDAKAGIEKYSKGNVKTPAYQEPWKAHQDMFSKHKDTVWTQAWDQQKGMYQWPVGMAVEPKYPDDSWGADELSNRSKFRDQYKTQFTNLESVVAPVEITGGINAVVPMQLWSTERAPSREEIWLAQEEFWVRREMLYIVADSLRAVAFFKPVKLTAEDEKLPAGIVVRRKFRNPNWEMDLRFEQSKETNRLRLSPTSTIKNINVTERTQPLANPRNQAGLVFRFWQGSAQFTLSVEGEPVPHGQSAAIKLKNPEVAPVEPSKPFGVEQVLEWEHAPVRKIEGFYLAHHSHRTADVELKIREDLKKLDPDPSEKEGAAAAPGGGMGGMMGVSAPPGGAPPGAAPGGAPRGGPPGLDAAPGAMGGNTPVGELTPISKVNRSRYLHVKDQARHMPIALKLIVDQAHIHDVLTAVATSRLRIQITQIQTHHVPTVQRVNPKDGKGGEPGSYAPPDGLAGPPGAGSGYQAGLRPPRGMGGPPPGVIPGTGDSGTGGENPRGGEPKGFGESTALVQDSARLVELSIYGIATLYERPRAKKEETPGSPTQKN